MLGTCLENVRNTVPLVHNITNYVTVNDVANILLACGGSPIMSDEPEDVEDITSICGGLNINIGTLNQRSIEGMFRAGAKANALGHVVLLDPVGAGASALRTNTAVELMEKIKFTVIRGNISEIKTLALGSGTTKGVDADVADAVDAMGHNHGVIEAIGVEQEELVKKRASIAKAEAERDVSCAKAAAAMAANEKEIEAQTAIAQRNNELELAKSKLKAEADKAAADANAAGMIQTNLRAKEVKESEADAEIARQKKMVDLAAQEAEVQQRKLDAEVRKQADAELYRRQKEAEAQKYEAERAAEAAKFAKQQEAEGIALVGKAEAEAIRQKGLAEAEAMKQKAEAYKQYNDAAVAEMMIKVLPEIARSVAQPLSSIDKVSIIGGDASGVSGVSGNVPVLMAQTMEAMKEATGIDMRDIVRANSIEAKTDRNITIKTEPEGEA